MQPSKIRHSKTLTQSQLKNFSTDTLLIFDKRLKSHALVKQFDKKLAVDAGEDLKDINQFSQRIEKIIRLTEKLPSRKLKIVALGGGSVGDFAGFVASVFKRGVPFYQIPSTWLAAVDSAHGGKTALNVPPFKNQIGTFYAAQEVFLLKDILMTQPEFLAQDAMSEVAKIALIDSKTFWRELVANSGANRAKTSSSVIWKSLKRAVEAKWRVVMQDPYEKSGYRQILNLGHTYAHFLEGQFSWSHGQAVAQGLHFANDLSLELKMLKNPVHQKIEAGLVSCGIERKSLPKSNRKSFVKALLQDKKQVTDSKVNFILIKDIGDIVIKPLSVDRVSQFAQRQGWLG